MTIPCDFVLLNEDNTDEHSSLSQRVNERMYPKSLEWCLRSKLLNKWYFFLITAVSITTQAMTPLCKTADPELLIQPQAVRHYLWLQKILRTSPSGLSSLCYRNITLLYCPRSGAHFAVPTAENSLKTKLLSILRPTFSHHCYQIIILKINPQEHMCLPSVILCGVWLFIKHAVVVYLRSHVWLFDP